MEVKVTVAAQNLLAKIAGMSDRLRESLLLTMRRLAIQVQREVKGGKLSGQVLNVRTGTLRRSINQEVRNEPGGIVAVVGTNVSYAHIHEYGFSGSVNVRAHIRRIRAPSKISKKTGQLVKGKLTGATTVVKAHQRQVNLPARSFLRSTLLEFEGRIRSDLRQAALTALQQGPQ